MFVISCGDLICYVGVSGDFNMIYWSDCVVCEVGLFGVIVYGMFIMVMVVWFVIVWVGDFGVVVEYGVCFIKFVLVDDVEGMSIEVCGVVVIKDDECCIVCVDFMVMMLGEDGVCVSVLGWVWVVVWLL